MGLKKLQELVKCFFLNKKKCVNTFFSYYFRILVQIIRQKMGHFSPRENGWDLNGRERGDIWLLFLGQVKIRISLCDEAVFLSACSSGHCGAGDQLGGEEGSRCNGVPGAW